MATKQPNHKTVFAAHIRAIQPSEDDVKEVKASLSDLKQLLPAGIDPDKDYDLLYVAGNLTVGGLVNLNDDGVDIATSLATYKQFERRFVDIEHDRKRMCGFILHAGLTEFGSDKIITEDEARAANKPFNIAIVGVLWKSANPEMCAYLEEASAPTHTDYKALSLSFEVGFENYSIIGLRGDDKVIANAELTIDPDAKDFGRFEGCLRARKGSGVSPDDSSLRLYRVLKDGVLPLGGGVVTVPAAAVKGIVAITSPNPEAPIADADDMGDDSEGDIYSDLQAIKNEMSLLVTSASIKELSDIIFQQPRVSPSTTKTSIVLPMKNQALQSFQDKIAKAASLEDVKTIFATESLSDIIAAESVRLQKEKEVAESLASELQKAKDAADATALQTAKDLEVVRSEAVALKAELAEIRTAQETAAAQQKFQERMTALNDIFDLDDETRAFFLDDVKACSTDEAFAKFMDKNKKLHKEKMKDVKKQKAIDDKKKDDDAKAALVAALAAKGIKASAAETGLSIEEIIASAVAAPVNGEIVNVIVPPVDIKDAARAAFAGAFTIGGKPAAEFGTKK